MVYLEHVCPRDLKKGLEKTRMIKVENICCKAKSRGGYQGEKSRKDTASSGNSNRYFY